MSLEMSWTLNTSVNVCPGVHLSVCQSRCPQASADINRMLFLSDVMVLFPPGLMHNLINMENVDPHICMGLFLGSLPFLLLVKHHHPLVSLFAIAIHLLVRITM
jgi:hypothetical protein